MLEYDRIDISKAIDINKTNASKECDMCHLIFLDKSFKCDQYICNGCHDLVQKLWILIMLLLFILKEIIKTLVYGIWAKMVQ